MKYVAGKRDRVCEEMKRKGRDMRKERRKGKREKWKKGRIGKKRGQEERGLKEGRGNHRVHCWHVARLALLPRRVWQLLELGCKGASAGKIACAAGCLLKELVLIDKTNSGKQILACCRARNTFPGKETMSRDEKRGKRKEERQSGKGRQTTGTRERNRIKEERERLPPPEKMKYRRKRKGGQK